MLTAGPWAAGVQGMEACNRSRVGSPCFPGVSHRRGPEPHRFLPLLFTKTPGKTAIRAVNGYGGTMCGRLDGGWASTFWLRSYWARAATRRPLLFSLRDRED